MTTQPTSIPTQVIGDEDELPDAIDLDEPNPLLAATIRISGFLIDIPEQK